MNPIHTSSAWVGEKVSSGRIANPTESDSKMVWEAFVSSSTNGNWHSSLAADDPINPYLQMTQTTQLHINLCH